MMRLNELFSPFFFNDRNQTIYHHFNSQDMFKQARSYLGSSINEVIPETICYFINKLRKQEPMEEKDFASFQQALHTIKEDKIYNALAYAIHVIARTVFYSYEKELKDSVQQIQDKTIAQSSEKIKPCQPVGLLNIYLLNNGQHLPLRNHVDSDFPRGPGGPAHLGGQHANKYIFNYHVPFAINAFKLTHKFPTKGLYGGLDLSENLYPKKYGGATTEIPLRRGIKNKKEWIPFLKIYKIRKGSVPDSIYLATNGKKILFIRGAKRPTAPSSIMASKIATFVSKKHFSSERFLSNQLAASKRLPEYQFSFLDNEGFEAKLLIESEKRVFPGTGIINEVLNFIQERDRNSENYGLSTEVYLPECSLSKIDFEHCHLETPLLKENYQQDMVMPLYKNLPHVQKDPKFIEEMLYTRLKLSLLTSELNTGLANKASDDKASQHMLAKEATNRADIAFELFLENKNAITFLQQKPTIMGVILQESLDYTKKHFDEPSRTNILRSLQKRFTYLCTKITDDLHVTLKIAEPPLEEKETAVKHPALVKIKNILLAYKKHLNKDSIATKDEEKPLEYSQNITADNHETILNSLAINNKDTTIDKWPSADVAQYKLCIMAKLNKKLDESDCTPEKFNVFYEKDADIQVLHQRRYDYTWQSISSAIAKILVSPLTLTSTTHANSLWNTLWQVTDERVKIRRENTLSHSAKPGT